MTRLEREVLEHRYRYYVLAEPIISDAIYDSIEREAREEQANNPNSPVHTVGSSLPSSYPKEIIDKLE